MTSYQITEFFSAASPSSASRGTPRVSPEAGGSLGRGCCGGDGDGGEGDEDGGQGHAHQGGRRPRPEDGAGAHQAGGPPAQAGQAATATAAAAASESQHRVRGGRVVGQNPKPVGGEAQPLQRCSSPALRTTATATAAAAAAATASATAAAATAATVSSAIRATNVFPRVSGGRKIRQHQQQPSGKKVNQHSIENNIVQSNAAYVERVGKRQYFSTCPGFPNNIRQYQNIIIEQFLQTVLVY